MQYWEEYLLKHPKDEVAKKALAALKKKHHNILEKEAGAERYLDGLAKAGKTISAVGVLALGSGTHPEVIERVEAAKGASGEAASARRSSPAPERPSDEEARRRSQRDLLRKKLDEAAAERNDRQLVEAVQKGLLQEHHLPKTANKYEDLLAEFNVTETVSDGNCLPHALLLPQNREMVSPGPQILELRKLVANIFRQKGYLQHGDGDDPEAPPELLRDIAGYLELNDDGKDVDNYAEATTTELYANIMERNGTWVGQTFLSCFARVDNKRVIVFRKIDNRAPDILPGTVFSTDIFGEVPFAPDAMTFILHAGNHYKALIPLGEVRRPGNVQAVPRPAAAASEPAQAEMPVPRHAAEPVVPKKGKKQKTK